MFFYCGVSRKGPTVTSKQTQAELFTFLFNISIASINYVYSVLHCDLSDFKQSKDACRIVCHTPSTSFFLLDAIRFSNIPSAMRRPFWIFPYTFSCLLRVSFTRNTHHTLHQRRTGLLFQNNIEHSCHVSDPKHICSPGARSPLSSDLWIQYRWFYAWKTPNV